MINFSFIQTPEQLQETAKEWEKCSELAIDIECENNLHHYGVFISLIQISSRNKNWIIDVLKVGENKEHILPLKKMLENPKIQKVFHDVSFDFRILNLQFQIHPKNIFDTQLAVLLLGKETMGLGALLEEYFQVQKEKKFQRVDWCRRPLTSEMLSYAVKDTAYLLQLKDKLTEELQAKKRFTWMEQEAQHQELMDFTYEDQQYVDLSGAKKMPPEQLALLRTLFDLREKTSEKVDRPNFMIMRNEILLDLVKNPPKEINEWQNLRGVHPIVKKEAQIWLNMIRKVQAGPGEVYALQAKKLNPAQFGWKEELTELRKKLGEKLKIRGHVLISNDQIIELVVSRNLNCLRPWQQELVKEEKIIKNIVK
ncbi:MAG: HRDC domain-containing protein [Nanoarchaeota archaeon]